MIEGAEEGILYCGISACPAFRLRFPARQITAVLSVRNMSQMIAVSHVFDEILAESTAKEADCFRTNLGANLNKPSSSQSPDPAERKIKEDSLPALKLAVGHSC
jgi:hypothetical protein